MKLKGKAGIFLTLAAGVGMVATIVLTAKKAPEAQKAKEEALLRKREATGDENAQLTWWESLKVQTPVYIPAITAAAATVGTMVISQIAPQSAIQEMEKWNKTYRDVTAKVNGEKAEQLISQITNQKLTQGTDGIKMETFVLHFNDQDICFDTTIVDVLEAEYDANRFFCGSGGLTFNQLLQLFHQENVERGEEFGWDQYLGDAFYGYSWIDFKHRRGMLNGKPVTFIEFPFEYHTLSEEELMGEETNSTLMNHGVEGIA